MSSGIRLSKKETELVKFCQAVGAVTETSRISKEQKETIKEAAKSSGSKRNKKNYSWRVEVWYGFKNKRRDPPSKLKCDGGMTYYGTPLNGDDYFRLFGDCVMQFFYTALFDNYKRKIKKAADSLQVEKLDAVSKEMQNALIHAWNSGLLNTRLPAISTMKKRISFGLPAMPFGSASGQIASMLVVGISMKIVVGGMYNAYEPSYVGITGARPAVSF